MNPTFLNIICQFSVQISLCPKNGLFNLESPPQRACVRVSARTHTHTHTPWHLLIAGTWSLVLEFPTVGTLPVASA